jgi:hypothetical protein
MALLVSSYVSAQNVVATAIKENVHANGYIEFSLAPPHNEIDPGICGLRNTDTYCSAFARYMLGENISIQPFANVPYASHLRTHFNTNLLLGKTIPQYQYTWSPKAIGIERSASVGIMFSHNIELVGTQHYLFDIMNSDYKKSDVYKGNNGPWGRYNTVSVRKYINF